MYLHEAISTLPLAVIQFFAFFFLVFIWLYSSCTHQHDLLVSTSAVITGASSGIGKNIALQAKDYGVQRMLIMGRSREKLANVADQCRIQGIDVTILAVDFTSAEGCAEARQAIRDFDDIQPIDIIFSNAGMTVQNAGDLYGDIMSTDFFHNMVHVNTLAMFEIATAVLDRMRERRHGHIVFTGSINGLWGPANMVVYNACKSAIVSLARDLHVLLRSYDIHVSLVLPGFIQHTGISESHYKEGAMLPRCFAGNPHRLAKKIWNGVSRGEFAIIYPYSHYWVVKLIYNLGPTAWLFGAETTTRSSLVSAKWT